MVCNLREPRTWDPNNKHPEPREFSPCKTIAAFCSHFECKTAARKYSRNRPTSFSIEISQERTWHDFEGQGSTAGRRNPKSTNPHSRQIVRAQKSETSTHRIGKARLPYLQFVRC